MMTQSTGGFDRTTWHRLRLVIAVTLIILTVQGWFGDTINLFTVPSNPAQLISLRPERFEQS